MRTHKRLNGKARRAIEAAIVITLASALFALARLVGVAQRGNTLWGGEVMVPFLVILGWYGIKSLINDIKGGDEE